VTTIARFKKGDRVRLNEAGLAAYSLRGGRYSWKSREGTVVSDNKWSTVRVEWDGNSAKTTTYVHHSFVRLAD
jgi:hypothetical protein